MATPIQSVTSENFQALLKRLSDDELLLLYNTIASFYNSRHHRIEEKSKPIYPKRYIAEDGLPVWDLGFTGTFDREVCYEE